MLRRFTPRAILYSVVVALALPLSPLAQDTTETTPAEPAPPAQPPPAPEPVETTPEPQPPPPQPEAKREPVAVAAASGSVSIVDFSFSPGSITIDAGDSVTWVNNGEEPHTATGDGFDTGLLQPGASGSASFNQAGSFSYICTPHPFMKGTVVVRAAAAGDSPDQTSETSPQTSGTQQAPTVTRTATGPRLPNSGADPLPLFVLGAGLLAIGLLSRRRLA